MQTARKTLRVAHLYQIDGSTLRVYVNEDKEELKLQEPLLDKYVDYPEDYPNLECRKKWLQ